MKDAPGAGPEVADAPLASGGVAGIPAAGGTLGSGGLVASGGVVSSGGKPGTDAPVASGGAPGSGGASGTGGAVTFNCANAVVPANGTITDFTDWNATTATWGTGALTGNVYQYGSTGATMSAAKVEGTPAGLHISGSIPGGNYGGGGLTFFSCVSVASFTRVSFTVYGSASSCSIELQLQTYDQRPMEQVPPGACKSDGGSSCFKFPAKSQVVSLSTAVAAPGTTVTATLSSFTNWSTSAAGQIVGMQWQFTPSGGTCTPNATFTNIKFLP